MFRDQLGWIGEFEARGAYWRHDGNALRPHAVLTSLKHSGGFFNSEAILQDPILADEAATDLVELLEREGFQIDGVDRVVGPAMGAITIAHDVARHIGFARLRPCLRAYTEPVEVDGQRSMIFKKTDIQAGEQVLHVEDVVTTGLSIDLAETATLRKGGKPLPFVAALVNRSGLTVVNGKRIVALINMPMPMWDADDCPLCKAGSEALRPPKIPENWKRLNAAY